MITVFYSAEKRLIRCTFLKCLSPISRLIKENSANTLFKPAIPTTGYLMEKDVKYASSAS